MKWPRLRRLLPLLIIVSTMPLAAQVNLSAQLVNRELRLFFLNDFNLTGRGTSAGEIFRLAINNGPAPASFQLRLEILYNDIDLLASGITRPVEMTANSFIIITNQNLFTQAQKFSLQDYTIEETGGSLREKVLASGRLPSGVYRFTFTLLNPTEGGVLDEAFIELEVSNPNHLELIAPGSPADRGAPEPIWTTLPVFRWTSNLDRFRLRIAEKLRDLHDAAGPEEIIQDRIRFERFFVIDPGRSGGREADGAEILSSTLFQYPAAGAWPLERGKVYYWQVTGLTPGSGALLEWPGEIWAFQVSELDDRAEALAGSLVLERLRVLLGDRYDALFSTGGELAGYLPGGRYQRNGRWISGDEVQSLLGKLIAGEQTLIDVRVE